MKTKVFDRKVTSVNLTEQEIKELIKENVLKTLAERGQFGPVVEVNVIIRNVTHPIDSCRIEARVDITDFGPNDHQRILKENNAGHIF